MKKSLHCTIVFCVCFLLSGQLISQQLLKRLDLESLVEKSSLVIEGKVLYQMAYWDADKNNIYTCSTVEVYKVFKGEAITAVNVVTRGGTVGQQSQIVNPSLKLRKGDIGIFVLKDIREALKRTKAVSDQYMAVGSAQGFYKYNLHNNTVVNVFEKKEGMTAVYAEIVSYTSENYKEIKTFSGRSMSKRNITGKTLAPSISGLSPSTISAGTKSVLTITGSGFGLTEGTVGFRNAMMEGKPL